MSALAAICARGSPGRPRGASPCPRVPREALGPHAAELVGAGQSAASQAPSCSVELPAPRLTSSPFTPAALLPGLNVSRSCTDEGWTHLEPGPYPIACGSNDKGSGSEELQQVMFYTSVKTGYTIGYGLSLATLLVAMAILSLFR